MKVLNNDRHTLCLAHPHVGVGAPAPDPLYGRSPRLWASPVGAQVDLSKRPRRGTPVGIDVEGDVGAVVDDVVVVVGDVALLLLLLTMLHCCCCRCCYSLWCLETCQQGQSPGDLHGCLLTCATLDV